MKNIYFMFINLKGLYNDNPLIGYWSKNLKCWHDKSGNHSCKKLGLDIQEGYITFSSYNKKDVLSFIKGAKVLTTVNQTLNYRHF